MCKVLGVTVTPSGSLHKPGDAKPRGGLVEGGGATRVTLHRLIVGS